MGVSSICKTCGGETHDYDCGHCNYIARQSVVEGLEQLADALASAGRMGDPADPLEENYYVRMSDKLAKEIESRLRAMVDKLES